MSRHVRVAAQLGHRGVRADDGQGLQSARVQRQHTVVLQQDHRLARHVCCERTSFGVVGNRLRVLRIRVGVLEQPGQELHAQHPAHGIVDLLLGDPAVGERLGQQPVGFAIRHVEIHSRIQGAHGRTLQVRLDMMQLDELLDPFVVADHGALEAHLVPQDVVQQPPVGM